MDKKIIFIEDDEFLARIYQNFLEEHGFDVFLATLAEDGLKVVKREKPDLIVLALLLPDIEDDLFFMIKTIKGLDELKDIPIVILSNVAQYDDVQEALKLGVDSFLIKAHTTPEMLFRVIERILNK